MTAIASNDFDKAEERRQNLLRIRAIVGASSGNLVEWYDFYTYAFTSIYFAASFSPKGASETTQLLYAAVIFAIGFFMRPLGSWLFGWIADTKGRKVSMVSSVLLMCAGSLMIACLPTVDDIGMAAAALMLIARIAQGLSVGGEYGTAATYMSEVASPRNRGFLSSFQYVTLIGGQLLAVLVLFVLQQLLTVDQLKAWGWRIPFAIGAVGAIVAMFLRRTLQETASAEAMKHKETGSLRGLLPYTKSVLITLGLTMGGSLYFYAFSTYMQKYLVNTAKMPATTVTAVMTPVLIVFMLVQPLFGSLSDRIGRKRNLLLFAGLGCLGVVPLYSLLAGVTSPLAAFVLVTIGLLFGSFYTSVSGVAKAELFPPEVRALGVGLPYAIANAIFGGTAEAVALQMKASGIEGVFPWYVAAMVFVSLLAALWMPDTRKHGFLDGDGKI
jgi:MFS family permease